VLRDVHVGSSLFLLVAKPGGRIWIGDVHALQGDGVDQTAIETAAENLEIRYDLHSGVALGAPLVETDESWIVIGFADSLDDALTGCLRELISWLAAATERDQVQRWLRPETGPAGDFVRCRPARHP
jgi:acetamidase/formamidase